MKIYGTDPSMRSSSTWRKLLKVEKNKMFSQNTPPGRLTNEGTTKRIAFSLRPFPDGRRTRTDKGEKENRVERK